MVYVGARDTDAIPNYVIPELNTFAKDAVASVSQAWARESILNQTISRQNIATSPHALTPAIGFTTVDLRPFGPLG